MSVYMLLSSISSLAMSNQRIVISYYLVSNPGPNFIPIDINYRSSTREERLVESRL